jgi:hypothetical protein
MLYVIIRPGISGLLYALLPEVLQLCFLKDFQQFSNTDQQGDHIPQ